MDFEPNPAQAELLTRLEAALAAHGPPAAAFDAALYDKLVGLGPLAPLEATLVVERASRAGAVTPYGATALLGSLLPGVEGVIAVADPRGEGPSAFGAEATTLVRFEGEAAVAWRCDPARAWPAKANYIYPLATPVTVGEPVARIAAAPVRRRLRLALAAEAAGALEAALAMTSAYLTERRQFGRPLGAFQALQHRAAELAVRVEGTRWLTRTAAWADSDEEAAVACAYAARAARRMAWEAHQLHGARGFTDAYGLARHTLRLQYLSTALGGAPRHAADAARLRWAAA